MSNISGPMAALPPAKSAAGLNAPGLEQTHPGLGTESLKADPWVKALFSYSQTAVARERSPSPRPELTPAKPSITGDHAAGFYSLADTAPQLANPLAPLRDRAALTEIFTHAHMAAIEADILNRLSYLVPEPPWEVEPYEFLRELLEL
ncbi:hypothetical protein VB780_03965 [Leptolyngbya sp. CCNP1308]|uniref:hypothetical protein n=1 Tax=Leptolyngbya sp. CCNP1308 TaxID=3110255 RepID=UPI002B20C960|nr:hypothetical protein [Leptolyngbya sp. CCNP1308]MEA5447712.1 hypothetical protein [Leptolyngbya sp. CCNP1308]